MNTVNPSLLSTYSPELQNVIKKIVGQSNVKAKAVDTDWSNHMSAASKKINILKNIQNKIFIKQSSSSQKIQEQKDKIRRYMKDNNVDIAHLNEITSVFLDCDEERKGAITKKQLLEKIAENNLQFPADFLFCIMKDMQQNTDDQSEEALLLYENLQNIIEVYNNCPIFLKGDSNNSDSFKQNMDKNRNDMIETYDRLDKLFKYVHLRIEEKFRDFRQAFRNFDKNFDGGLNFKEFITGMDCIGIKLKLSDYRKIFEALDYDQEGEIGFFKFCLLNTDRKHDLQKLREEHEKKQNQQEKQSQKSRNTQNGLKIGKPPLHTLSVFGTSSTNFNPLFGDGNIPKNKDINNFQKDVQDITPNNAYMKKRFERSAQKFGYKTYMDFPETHSFGMAQERKHDMVALLTNSYSETLKSISIEELRSQASKKNQLSGKQTYGQQLRDKAIKVRYFGNRSSSLNNTLAGSTFVQNQSFQQQVRIKKGLKKRSRNQLQLMLEGSNKFATAQTKQQTPSKIGQINE